MPNPDADYGAMSDNDLAQACYEASCEQDVNAILLIDNEIASRLDLSPDDTEQGFTLEAEERIREFLKAQLGERVANDLYS